MAFNWVTIGAEMVCDANPIIIPGTDRHLENVLLQKDTLVSQESYSANIGNGKTVTVTINDVIRKSGRPKWEVVGVCSDGRTTEKVEEKSAQPDKMNVADTVARMLM
jgi:hypothetical protein